MTLEETPELNSSAAASDRNGRAPRIDLVLWGTDAAVADWRHGKMHPSKADAASINRAICDALADERVDGLLCWDASLGAPDDDQVLRAWRRPGDLWHAGLRLGMGGLPTAIDFVEPTWTLNRDPDPLLEATSWRVSLRACLMRSEVPRQMGLLDARFASLEASALEFGHRCIIAGVFTRHFPGLVPNSTLSHRPQLSPDDEFLFVKARFGAKWTRWALCRAAMSRELGPIAAWRVYRSLRREPFRDQPMPFHGAGAEVLAAAPVEARVTVVVPTVDRYPYLRVLLAQLRRQTLPPTEILVVDQTAAEHRDPRLYEEFVDLPLRVFYLDQPGQCSSRNLALRESDGDFILLLDDDIEIEDNLIAAHVATLDRWRADVASGVANEVGAGPMPEHFRRVRSSDVFPAGISMVRREALRASGLFDLAYERGQRADGDLGMRLNQSGAMMVLNPSVSVLHHRAPSGGLRKHKARVQTYAGSRRSLWTRQLPSATEFYLGARFFTPRQRRESLWMSVLGTFSVRGGAWRRAAKALISGLALPSSLRLVRKRRNEAMAMLRRYPEIPALPPDREAAGMNAAARLESPRINHAVENT